jgi:hypothetical protein
MVISRFRHANIRKETLDMHRRPLIGGIAGLLLGLAMMAAAIPTFAKGQGHRTIGKITQVSSSSLQVQTAAGSVTEQLTSSTRVVKETHGTRADLTPGTFVSVTLAPGTKTITAIHVRSKVGTSRHLGTGTHSPRGHAAGTTSKPKTGLHQRGQIVSVANGQLSLKDRKGQITTYTLSQNVSVTKTVPGQLSDLAIGETVRIAARTGSTTALAVTIVGA